MSLSAGMSDPSFIIMNNIFVNSNNKNESNVNQNSVGELYLFRFLFFIVKERSRK